MKDWMPGALSVVGASVLLAPLTSPFAQENGFTEQPTYESVQQQGRFEVRDYPRIIVAEVTHSGTRRETMGMGFRRLAAYIFGQDRPDQDGDAKIAMTAPVIQDSPEKIAMTAPVTQDSVDGETWRTRFVMPSKYTMETLPTPPADITLTELPARRMATLRFPGVPDDQMLAMFETALRGWMEREGLEAAGPAEYAFYSSPMVPALYRRNEVMIPVVVGI